jgi:hypothetical protein
MARCIVPVLMIVALVGGYVLAQQLEEQPAIDRDGATPHPITSEQRARDGVGVINDLPARQASDPNLLHYELIADLPRPHAPVGRYVPADGGRMLDTTNGTLYAVEGDRWRVVARPLANEAAAQRPSERAVLLAAVEFLRSYNFSAASSDRAHALAAELAALLVE